MHVAIPASIPRFHDINCNVCKMASEARSRKGLASKQDARMMPCHET